MSTYDIDDTIQPGPDFERDPAWWLAARAQEHGLRYLLAHADDGVIWGRIDGGKLVDSHMVASEVSPKLRGETLQQCRLFGPAGELLVWRDDIGWRARLATDTPGAADDVFDEDQLLWGTHAEPQEHGFTLLHDGAQGMCHAVPIRVRTAQLHNHELRLRVRHYIEYDGDSGEARIGLSRLVTLLPEAE